MSHPDKVILAGYLVRCPLGGYAWQVLQYMAGLRAAGFDPYFYEDTAYYWDCFDPTTGKMPSGPEAGLRCTRELFERYGFGDRWVFWDAQRGQHHGMSASDLTELLWETRYVITLAAVTRLPRRHRECKIFLDIDPGFTQIVVDQGKYESRGLLAEHDLHFTFGENIGTPGCHIPNAGFEWRPTRQPIATDWWEPLPADSRAPFTTIGRWNESARDLTFEGVTYCWRKRVEWMKFLELPQRTQSRFAPAIDADRIPEDAAALRAYGWATRDPVQLSADAMGYRDFIRGSRGEFTVAKDLNVRLATGWFSDRAACYLAAGRPVINQDTGFGNILPVGDGLFAVRTLDDATAAVAAIQSNYDHHSAAARAIAKEYFEAGDVMRRLMNNV